VNASTGELVLGMAAALFGAGCAWLLSERWAARDERLALEEELDLSHQMVAKLSYHVIHFDEANRELASFAAVIHELVEICADAPEGSHAGTDEWLGKQVQTHLRELLECGWEFDADLEEGGFRARKEL
jgi:hypothetical protein